MDIYRKEGRKYIPFGVGCDISRLPEGIYAVYKTRSGSACCNLDFYGNNSYRLAKVGDIPNIDLSTVAGLEKRWLDVVTDAINESIGENLTIADTARRILSAIVNEKAREEKGWWTVRGLETDYQASLRGNDSGFRVLSNGDQLGSD